MPNDCIAPNHTKLTLGITLPPFYAEILFWWLLYHDNITSRITCETEELCHVSTD